MAELHKVKSRTTRTCGKCGSTIQAGETYQWWQFYGQKKEVRCMTPGCGPGEVEPVPGDLSASEEAVIRQFNSTSVRHTYRSLLDTKLGDAVYTLDDPVYDLDRDLASLEQKGYLKSHVRNGERIYRRVGA